MGSSSSSSIKNYEKIGKAATLKSLLLLLLPHSLSHVPQQQQQQHH